MAEITATDWLEHRSIRIAQDCAVRLATASHAVLPSDKNLRHLVSDQIKGDILDFAFHTRKVLERRGHTDATVASDPLWPASVSVPLNSNFFDILGTIVHAKSIDVCWETPELNPNPYNGHTPQFAGSLEITSDKTTQKFAVGAIVASFISSVLNRSDAKSK
jgi:hypothetical protein